MLTRCLILIGLIVALAVPSGCGGILPAQKETMLDKNWGSSFESAKQNQILNPEAEKNLEPVVGMDGQAAEGSLGEYRKGFTKQASEKKPGMSLAITPGGISPVTRTKAK